jgi:hypothetical protein
MRATLKVDPQWLELEQKSMNKLKREYEYWASKTLRKAQEAVDLRSLREVFYELGDRWEFEQATGDWLAEGEPLDAIGLILRLPGFKPNKERYIVYAVMAYSKGFTDQFDHLGDKERIIIERDTETGKMYCWSTTGHGAMDLFPMDLSQFSSIDEVLKHGYLVAQPGDHALRLEVPRKSNDKLHFFSRLWEIATGSSDFTAKEIQLLSSVDIEERLDFQLARYAKAVISLEQYWATQTQGAIGKAKEAVLDKIPNHIESIMTETLRKVEDLLHRLWFTPPVTQLDRIRKIYDDLISEPTPTEIEQDLIPYLGELIYSLNDIIEKAQYLKWKSVIDQKSFDKSDIFHGLDLSRVAKEAFAVALDDILREHTLAYIGYPERGTLSSKAIRGLFGFIILPLRLAAKCVDIMTTKFSGFLKRSKFSFRKSEKTEDLPQTKESSKSENTEETTKSDE